MITEYIKNLVNLTGADIHDKLFVDDLTRFLCEIKEPEAFRQYAIKELAHTENLKFKNPYEKLYRLSEEYRKVEFERLNVGRLEQAKTAAEKLADKVKAIAPELMINPQLAYENFKKADKINPYFTDFEEKTLSNIGSLAKVCAYTKDVLIEKIYAQNEKIIKVQVSKAITIKEYI
jgi:hypothetical protein